MLGMTDQQKLDLLRQVLMALGSVATALGFFSAEVVSGFINTVMQVAGPAMMIIGLVWGMFANRQSALVTAVANMAEVKTVTLNPGETGTRALNAATPENVTIASTPAK